MSSTEGALGWTTPYRACVCWAGSRSPPEDGVVEERAWRLRKAKALVKLLALAPERRLHRERLADLLWPDRDAEAAANNLHQALHAARRAIGPDALRLSDGVVALEAEVDVDAFEAAAARARATGEAADYESALDLHAGELLPEDRYESWADARRPRCSSSTAPCASSWPSCTATTRRRWPRCSARWSSIRWPSPPTAP